MAYQRDAFETGRSTLNRGDLGNKKGGYALQLRCAVQEALL